MTERFHLPPFSRSKILTRDIVVGDVDNGGHHVTVKSNTNPKSSVRLVYYSTMFAERNPSIIRPQALPNMRVLG
jgi:hypothetical protein